MERYIFMFPCSPSPQHSPSIRYLAARPSWFASFFTHAGELRLSNSATTSLIDPSIRSRCRPLSILHVICTRQIPGLLPPIPPQLPTYPKRPSSVRLSRQHLTFRCLILNHVHAMHQQFVHSPTWKSKKDQRGSEFRAPKTPGAELRSQPFLVSYSLFLF